MGGSKGLLFNANSGNSTLDLSSYQQKLTQNTTYYVATTGNDSTGDGSSDTPWATIAKAIEVLRERRLSYLFTSQIVLEDGEYAHSDDLNLNHVNGQRIIIKGENTYSLSSTNINSSSGSAGAWEINIAVADTTNVAVGDYAIVSNAANGTNPEKLEGAHRVSAKTAGSLTLTVTNKTTSAPSGAVTADLKIIKSVISFSSGGLVLGDSAINLENIAIEGPGSTNNGLDIKRGVANFTDTIFASWDKGLIADVSQIYGSAYFTKNNTNGAELVASQAKFTSFVSVGSGAGVHASGSILALLSGNFQGNTTGIYTVACNGIIGAGKFYDSIVRGIYSGSGSAIKMFSGTIANNILGTYAEGRGSIDVPSGAVTFSGNTSDSSPTFNTVGNNEGVVIRP